MGRPKKPVYVEPTPMTPEETKYVREVMRIAEERIAELKQELKITSGWKEKEFIRAHIKTNKEMYNKAFRRLMEFF